MNLNDFSAAPNEAVDFGNLPAQGGSAPPPYPGGKRFQLPETLSVANFEEYAGQDGKKYVRVKFDEAAPLLIVQSAVADEQGTPFQQRLSSQPRKRNKAGAMAADLDYLFAKLGEKARPASNRDIVLKLIEYAKKKATFGADVEWSWACGTERDARFRQDDGQGNVSFVTIPVAEGSTDMRKGCGAKYYQADVEAMKEANGGKWPLHITCAGGTPEAPCGADLRAFGNLTNFRQ